MHANDVSRRQVLKAGAIAAALAGAGRLPLLSAASGADPSIDASTGPYAVKPVRDHLRRFSPVQAELTGKGKYNLAYDIIHWNWVNGKQGTFGNSVVGRVAIGRNEEGDQVVYEVNQQTSIGGVDNIIEAGIVCEANDLNPVRRWTLQSYSRTVGGEVDPQSRLSEKGRCDDGHIRIESGDHDYGFVAARPVVTQWTILDALMRHTNSASDRVFDLLQDLSLFKPQQLLAYDGVTSIRLRGGRTVELQTYAQTGQGVLPIHYLLDEQSRPQLITTSIVSWALSNVSD